MAKVRVQLFGAFRAHGQAVTLEIADQGSVEDVRTALAALWGPERAELICLSRFADARAILPENAPVADGSTLAILPPVSGG